MKKDPYLIILNQLKDNPSQLTKQSQILSK